VILPFFTKPNYPLDVIEGFVYGQEWVLSSGKHPPLPSWIMSLVFQWTGKAEVTPYLCSQLIVALAFFSIWQISRRMLPPLKALFAVCVMEYYTYFTFYSLEFNNSIALLGCWSLATLSFFYTLKSDGKLRYWTLTGLFLGLGVLAKYSGFDLVLMLLLFMVWDPRARRYWKTPGPYLTTLIAAAVFLPHFLDVVSHRFSTLQYLSERMDEESYGFHEHFVFPVRFLLLQTGVVASILVVFFIFNGRIIRRRTLGESEQQDARFLNMLVLWPLGFQVLISAVFALRLDTIYGSHLWIFLGLYLAFFLEIEERFLTLRRIAFFAVWGMILMATLTTVRDVTSPHLRNKPSRIHYPGKEIARQVEDIWHERYSIPCPHLVGEWWLTGNVVAYGNDSPRVFSRSDADHLNQGAVLTVWADPESINREGGVCLWTANRYPESLPPQLLELYPTAEIQPTVLIPFSTSADLAPLELGIAIVPPPYHKHTSNEDIGVVSHSDDP
jgi:hypothetical protein